MRQSILFFFTFLVGCGPGLESQAAESKPFFDIWISDDTSALVDLRPMTFGSPSPITFVLPNSVACSCQILLQGDGTTGQYAVTGCTPGPVCAGLDEDGFYSKAARQLMFCSDSTSCALYH